MLQSYSTFGEFSLRALVPLFYIFNDWLKLEDLSCTSYLELCLSLEKKRNNIPALGHPIKLVEPTLGA
jgi:hypothetical protein